MAKGPRYFYEGFRQQFGDGIGGAVRFALRARDAAKAAEAQQARWDDEMTFRVQQRDALAQEHRENLAAQRSRDLSAAAHRASLLEAKRAEAEARRRAEEARLAAEEERARLDRESRERLQREKEAEAFRRAELQAEASAQAARIGAAGRAKQAKPGSWADPRTAAHAMKSLAERLQPYTLSSGQKGEKARNVLSGAGRLFYQPTLDPVEATQLAQDSYELIHDQRPTPDDLARAYYQLWGVNMQ